MVIATALALLIGGAAPAPQCTPASEFQPAVCPTGLPKIRSVTIATNAATAYADADEPKCDSFRLDPKIVTGYLTRAGKVDPQEAHHTLDVSPCHATGTVRFGDGSSGEWRIDRYRVGHLTRKGQPDLMLFCPDCKAKPFAW